MAERTTSPRSRSDLISDAALEVLAEHGMRGLTHRAVDQAAQLPQGSTSNLFRTRQTLLEAVIKRLMHREASVLGIDEMPAPSGGLAALADAMALAVHRSLTQHRALLVARYELALESTRRPELRTVYDTAGSSFRRPLQAIMAAAGSTEPERHTVSLIAWSEGLMFTYAAGADHSSPLSLDTLRAGLLELLHGMLDHR
ncbi:TetR/AcrR family transcriptional regulator [Streptomyces albipurpureus]|uniref:TetR family transcriptional regulator n=1 Tax=Streptomyces albipurpureus TaxID=2897419 RepID=A0ABT0UT16_9ACTN|nr:TetR/AcrR family transcriptional regulator [Streptomyces sp. CWNU-1]MCM2391605.1 TetR family transcriptional regulator [Streptomyces sp. CWNU-1]